MGGMAMQKVYALAPERVRRMVGVSPVPASGVPFDERAWGLFSSAAGSPENRRRIINASTGGQLVARLALSGNGIELEDATAGSGNLSVTAAFGSQAAEYLGLLPAGGAAVSVPADTITTWCAGMTPSRPTSRARVAVSGKRPVAMPLVARQPPLA